jgi:hypothetical protein
MAIQVNASDIHLRSSQAMALTSTSAFTVTCWINATWNNGARRSFVGIYGGATDVGLSAPVTAIQIGTSAGAGDITCWTWGGGTVVGTAGAVMTPFNGLWVFICYTFDGTTHRVYRNGTELANSTTANITGFLNQVYINGFPGGLTSEVDAFQLDQYALFRRTLSQPEIQTMYLAGGARHGNALSQICRFEFDEGIQGGTTSSVVDMTGNGNTLTALGGGSPITYTYSNTFANANIRPVQ